MKSRITLAAAIGLACAVSASAGFAQSSAPGSTLPKPNKVAAVPPPPPGGPDKLATRAHPIDPGVRKPRDPSVVDDFKGGPGWVFSTCYPAAGPNCVSSLDKLCTKRGGGMSSNPDGSVTCTVYD